MNDAFPAIIIPLFICLAIASMVWRGNRSRDLVEGWARENGFRLLSAEECWFSKGPFFWTTSKGQVVFRVEVQDGRGQARSGWVRCGSWFGGLWSDQTEVRWE